MSKCFHGTDLSVQSSVRGNTVVTEYPYCPKCLGLPEGPMEYITVSPLPDGTWPDLVLSADGTLKVAAP